MKKAYILKAEYLAEFAFKPQKMSEKVQTILRTKFVSLSSRFMKIRRILVSKGILLHLIWNEISLHLFWKVILQQQGGDE